jgi:hypothetical protein
MYREHDGDLNNRFNHRRNHRERLSPFLVDLLKLQMIFLYNNRLTENG